MKKLYSKAQLSIETMIIYGLVILVALSVLGALIYFNVLDLGAYLPDTCSLGGTGDLKCEEMKFSGTDSEIQLGIRNIGKKPIESLTVYVADKEAIHFSGEKSGSGVLNDGVDTPISDTSALAPGEIAKVTIDTANALPGKVLTGTLRTVFKYKGGAIEQEAAGTIRVKAT